jgi:hypothetical protein
MARAPRTEEVAQERRRRTDGTLDRTSSLKLAVPENVRADNPGFTFRWGNDEGNRMYARTVQDDWDKVTGVDPIPVGTDPEGKPIYAHLLKKRQDFWEADQKAKADALAETERGLVRGDNKETQAAETAYAVEGNRISTGYTP